MNRKLLLSTIALLPLLGTAAYGAAPDQPGHQSPAPGTANDTMSAVKDTAGHAVGVVSAEMTTSLKGFVTEAATSDMFEVAAAKVAVERSSDPEIKAFANKMIAAHTETTATLKSLIAGHKDVMPPTALDDRRQGMLDELRGAKAADFDGRYVAQQVAAHKEALILMQGYAKSGDDKAVKHFANKTAAAVQMHLTMANKLEAMQEKKKS